MYPDRLIWRKWYDMAACVGRQMGEIGSGNYDSKALDPIIVTRCPASRLPVAGYGYAAGSTCFNWLLFLFPLRSIVRSQAWRKWASDCEMRASRAGKVVTYDWTIRRTPTLAASSPLPQLLSTLPVHPRLQKERDDYTYDYLWQ